VMDSQNRLVAPARKGGRGLKPEVDDLVIKVPG